MSDLTARRSHYRTFGYAVIDELTDAATAAAQFHLFESAEYDYVVQTRKRKYSYMSKAEDPELPGQNESYVAKFFRSDELTRNQSVKEFVDKFIRSPVSAVSQVDCTGEFSLRAYRLDPGHYFRSHVDDYAGPIGFIYYLCVGWKWDWGGILHIKVNGEIKSSLPGYNRLVILDHSRALPHFVSPISEYALQSRYMLVGLLPHAKPVR